MSRDASCEVCGNIVDLVQQMKCYTMVIMEVDCIPMCQYVLRELSIYPSRYFILLWRPICYLDVIKTPTNNYCYFCVWKELYGLCVHVFFTLISLGEVSLNRVLLLSLKSLQYKWKRLPGRWCHDPMSELEQ